MGNFDIEILVAEDIKEQLLKAAFDDGWGFEGPVSYRCAVAKGYCEDLIQRLDERLKKDGK